METSSSTSNQPMVSGQTWWLAGIIAAVVAAIVNAIIYFIARAADWISEDFIVESPMGDNPIELPAVIFATVIPILLAAVLYFILARTTAQPIRILWIVGIVVLVLSFFQPFTIDDAPTDMILTLEGMHVVAVVVGLGVFTGLVRR